jgi:hypothetical protein
MGKHSVPAGDEDLSGGRPMAGENLTSGGVGPSGSSFSSTGHLGGMGNTSDGVGSRDDSIDAADIEINGLTDSMADALTLGDVVSDTTQSDDNGDALDGPNDPDDRPQADDDPDGPDVLTVDHSSGADRASGSSSSRS